MCPLVVNANGSNKVPPAKESNFARKNKTYLEIINNEWKVKSKITKNYALTSSTFINIYFKKKQDLESLEECGLAEKSAWL